MRILNAVLVAAIFLVASTSFVDAAATAGIDIGFPNWTNSVEAGIPPTSGTGFEGSNLSDGTPTSCSSTGRLKAVTEGVNVSGGAVLWEQQEWRGTIQTPTGQPKWVVTVAATVRSMVFVEQHYVNEDSTYSADAFSRVYFDGVNLGGSHTYVEAKKTVSIAAEDTFKSEPAALANTWEIEDTKAKFYIHVTANGNISTGRADEMYVNSKAYLESAVSGQAKAYDGANLIQGGTFNLG
jgi:hypothetical protein